MSSEPLLRVRNLRRMILRNISLDLHEGQLLALVGPSGSGKSTLARCIARQDTVDAGEVLLDGRATWPRYQIQLIFQEPAASLNERFTAAEAIAEPLVVRGVGTRQQRLATAVRWMEIVGLRAGSAGKRTSEFSGGERQRIAIARALAAEPKLLILDESLSGLDYVLQKQITDLLRELRHRLQLTCLLISHDIALTARLADRVAVLDAGELAEEGAPSEIMSHAKHPRTQQLVAASLALAGGAPA